MGGVLKTSYQSVSDTGNIQKTRKESGAPPTTEVTGLRAWLRMNIKIRKYIDDYTFCSELLFKDWESFLDLLYAEGGRVSSILWWDHCTKKQLK